MTFVEEIPKEALRNPFTGEDYPRILAWLVTKHEEATPLGEADSLERVSADLLVCRWERSPGRVDTHYIDFQTPWNGRTRHKERLKLWERDTLVLTYSLKAVR